jgi:hypothetical protein
MYYSDIAYYYNRVIFAYCEIKPFQGLEEESFVYPWAAPTVIEIKPFQGLAEINFANPWVAPADIEIKPFQGLEEKSFVYPWVAPEVIEIKPFQGLAENHLYLKEVQRTSIIITSGATGGTIKHKSNEPRRGSIT